ncbi:MAG: site-specific integrase, partial [Planctomycetes bacterium]|nr:site-specific integrase [Planctomycetota bacterium]
AEWMSGGPARPVSPEALTINRLILLYSDHARDYYRPEGGGKSRELECIELALGRLRRLYGSTLAAGFGARQLKALRQDLLVSGAKRTKKTLSRKTINEYVNRVRRLFRWAVAEELVPSTVLESLRAVENLRRGRSAAREPEPVRPVADADIDTVIGRVSAQVGGMIRLQLLTGMRPGEVLAMRAGEVDRDGDDWVYAPAHHKSAHRGRTRRIFLGPRSREILMPFLEGRRADQYVFCPTEAEQARHARQRLERKSRVQPSQVDRRKEDPMTKPGDRYTIAAYRRAITRACEDAGIPAWNPHRLRHSAGTRIRREYGLEASRVVLGHGYGAITEVYAERDEALAAKVMRETG